MRVLALLVLGLAGCHAAITHSDVVNLRTAIVHERAAVVPRPGFEVAVAVERSGVDAKLDAMDKATSR